MSGADKGIPVDASPPAPTVKSSREHHQSRAHLQGSALEWDEAEPSTDEAEGGALFSDIVAVVNRYMVLPLGVPETVALWTALTYLTDAVDVLPRLLLMSPTRACGKTRLLAVLGALVRRPLPTSSISPSAVFRVIQAEQPTLLLDEMDNARLDENPELRAVLNSGHERSSAFTVRNVGDQHVARRFSTWAPIAIACIGRMPDTVASRCIAIAMRRRARHEQVERLRSQLRLQLEPLRRRLVRWCLDNTPTIRMADPVVPEVLGDREADNWRALLAIADAIGGDWPSHARRAALASSGVVDEGDAGALLLSDLRDIFASRGTGRLASDEILTALNAMHLRPWADSRRGTGLNPHGLARLLRPFGVGSRDLRLGKRVVKGYEVSDLEDAFTRYLPVASATTRQAAPAANRRPHLPSATSGSVADRAIATQNTIDAVCSDVADAGSPRFREGLRERLVDPFDMPRDEESLLLSHGWEHVA